MSLGGICRFLSGPMLCVWIDMWTFCGNGYEWFTAQPCILITVIKGSKETMPTCDVGMNEDHFTLIIATSSYVNREHVY